MRVELKAKEGEERRKSSRKRKKGAKQASLRPRK
jgi:hypothetical protein